MKLRVTLLLTGLVALLASALPPAPARAQSDLFTPAVYVNDRVVTRYEIEQNKLFLALLRQPGDLEKAAVERLIEDKLRYDAALANGVTVAAEDVDSGMAEFAARVNLSTEEFIAAIGQAGVAPETFRAFVEAGILWRDVVRARFGPRAQISDAEVDRAFALASRQSGVQVLISEMVLPADTDQARAAAEQIAQRLAGKFISESAFAAEARARSAAPSRGAGGRLDWVPIGNLPPQISAQVIGLSPGQVSQPFPVTGAIVLFYLRELRETGSNEARALSADWAEYSVASAADAARVKGEIDTCDDLYGIAQGQPEDRLRRETRALDQVPADVATALAQLDENEASATFSRGGQPMVLMLCARTYEIAELDGEGGPSRAQIRNQLVSQRIASYADGYLAELKADATIRYQ